MSDDARPTAPVTGLLAIGACAMLLLVAGLGTWGVSASIAGAVMAQGEIVSDQHRHLVQHPRGGVVARVLVAEGDVVAEGELLAVLDISAEAAELAALEEELFEIAVRQARLRAEYAGAADLVFPRHLAARAGRGSDRAAMLADEAALFHAGRARLAGEERQLAQADRQARAQVDGLAAQLGAVALQMALADTSLETQQALIARGAAPRATAVALEKDRAVLAEHVARLTADRALAEARLTEIAEKRAHLRAQDRERAMAHLREAAPQLRKFGAAAGRLRQVIARAELRAPAAGVIHGLAISTPQAVLEPAAPFASIIPAQTRPRIQARLPVRDADLVEAGQQVALRFSSLDQKTTPQLAGEVVRVAPEPTENPRGGPPHFAVEVRVPPAELDRLPEGIVLLPGTPVETFIRTADRSPVAYLVKPMADYLARIFRDG